MKKTANVLILIFVFVFTFNLAAEQVEVNQLGVHPFYKSRDLKKEDLMTISTKRAEEVKAGFEKAGYPELYDAFIAQLAKAEIKLIEVNPGETIQWMLFKTKGEVEVKKDVIWTGKKPFMAYHFVVVKKESKDGKDMERTYDFVVPKICGNISLKSERVKDVTPPPPPPPPSNVPPNCDLKVYPAEIMAGQELTLDASGSSDPDGTLASAKFTITDDAGAIIEEKVVSQKPFIHKTTIKKAGTFMIKVVVTDNKAAISSQNCEAEVTVLKRSFFIADLGLLYQKDPAWFLPIRLGYMYKFNRGLSIIALAGVAPVVSGDDDTTAFMGDLVLTYWPKSFFIGGGVGIFHTSNKTRFDLIVNTGIELFPHFALFFEGRVAFDEFDVISDFGRFGLGFRLRL